jgi:hypothetical protein
MSGNIDRGPASDSPLGVRPLPSWPNLEFEHKRAKKLLARLHAGHPDALNEVRSRVGERGAPADFKLADAQFAIAREYGFTSWPRLVEYFTTASRHAHSGPPMAWYPRDYFEKRARSLLGSHRAGSEWAGRWLAAFVPRFYGMSLQEVFASSVSEDDARLAIARENKRPSWEALIEWIDSKPREDPWKRREDPLAIACKAIGAGDLAALELVVDAHPTLLRDSAAGDPIDRTLTMNALWNERYSRNPNARAITEWLESRGADVTAALNSMLLGFGMARMKDPPARSSRRMDVDDVAYWLGRGADPSWMPPNGIPVLEHALYQYQNGEAVDVIARRVVPRDAFWIAAGLGDVRSLERYVDRNGIPTETARRQRPDFMAMGPSPKPSLPDADDHEVIWEAFIVAGLNSRFAVLDWLLDRGFPIDYDAYGSLLWSAIANKMVSLVEHLVRRGANLDRRRGSSSTAREMAEEYFEREPSDPDTRRILELCGGRNPDTVLRTAAEKRAKAMHVSPNFAALLEASQDDAAGLGQDLVRPENVFVAMLRNHPALPLTFLSKAGVDVEKLRQSIGDRLVASDSAASNPANRAMRASPELETALKAARREAEDHRRDMVTPLDLLYTLLANETGPIAEMIREAGGTVGKARDALATVL